MRNLVRTAAVAALLAAASLASQPAQAMALLAPAGLKAAAEQINLTETVSCDWDRCGYYGPRRHYAPSRPYYRSYSYGYSRPYHRPYYRSYSYGYSRPYYRSYSYGYSRPYYRSYGYDRPYYRSYGYNRPYYRPGPALWDASRYRYLGRGNYYDTANVWN